MIEQQARELSWRCHTPNLLNEILNNNPKMGIFSTPINILGKLLAEVGERAAEINDPELNKLMVRLTIYSIADPASQDYDQIAVDKILAGKP